MKTSITKILSVITISGTFNLSATEPVLKSTGISFTENKGQVCDQNYKPRPDVLFSGTANGINYHLTNTGISYQLNRIDSWKETEDLKTNEKIKTADKTTLYRVDINWVGANLNTTILKGKELAGVNNYYLTQCPNGALNVKSFENITYKNIYNGIDIKWYEKNGQLEYDFIVEPNADHKQIKIEIKGAEKLSVNKKGELEIKTPLGTIIEQAPVAFQNNKQIKTEWQLINNKATFKILNYDKTQTLIIDPALRKWGTYYGGTADDYGRGCKTDASGNVFFTGYTANTTTTLIATMGSHQTVFGGGTLDAFLAKFNTSGVRLWSTYYGGVGNDVSLCVEVDGTNEYIGGYSTSTGTSIATIGSHQVTPGAGNDGFMAKFDQNGVRVWATFYGGTGSDVVNGCAKDLSGNIYFAGNSSSNGAISSGGHQNAYAGGGDGFLVKFNSSGVRQWGTYYGGTGSDQGAGCAFDATGFIYLVGRSQTNVGTAIAIGGHQLANSGGDDAYLVKFNSAGVRQWGTYYGGSSVDYGYSCATDASGNVFMVGQTNSPTSTLIATVGSNQSTFGGSGDAFFAKFNSAGVRQWGTYYGTNGLDEALSCTINADGDLLAVGSTNSPSGISTPGGHQPSLAGGYDGYLSCINKNTGQLLWGTYYGSGTGSEYSTSICSDNVGNLFMSGYSNTSGGTGVATVGSHQSAGNGLNDGFLAKFADCPTLTLSIAANSNTICSGQSATLTATGTGFTTYTWSTGSNNSNISVSPSVTTNYSLTAGTATATCSFDSFLTLSVTATPTVVVTPTSSVHCIGSATTVISASGATSYSWSTGSTANSISVTPSAYTIYTVTGYNGSCTNVKTSTIAASATPTVLVSGTPTQSFCTGTSLTLTAFGASTYTWSNGPLTFSNVVSPTVTTNYTVTGSNGLCTDTYFVIVNPVVTPSVNLNSSASAICTGGSATLTATGATSYSWNTTATTSSIIVSPSVSTNYTVTGYNGACIDTKTTNIGIATSITVAAVSNTSSICSGSSATLTANGASTYTWNTGSNATSIVITPTSSANYTVNGASGSCSGSITININVNPNPTVSVVSASSVICVGETTSLTANGANTYTWNTGDNTAVITVTPSGTTTYTLTGYAVSGCSNTSVFTQSVSACIGMNELNNSHHVITIYPNPTSNNLFIETDFSNFEFAVFDVLGKLVFENRTNSGNSSFNANEFAKGIYMIKLYSDGVMITKKVIVE
jgi:hypothetical protein